MSDIRLRAPAAASVQPPPATTDSDSDGEVNSLVPPPPRPPANRSAVSQTLASTAYLANLLPTGTLLAFQLLTPIFTNNGACDAATRPLTVALLLLLAASCFLASFTDSFRSPDGQIYYGFATFSGMWLFEGPEPAQGPPALPDLARYKIRALDWIHAVASMAVFGVMALRDRNVVSCLYPRPSHETQEVLDIVPIGVGILCGFLFVLFPTKRHGIGYPVTDSKNN